MSETISTKGGEGDLAILFPERNDDVAGVAVVMREYGFHESLKLHADIAALTDAMTDIALAGDFRDLDSLRAAFGAQGDSVERLIAAACDQPVAWVAGLKAQDGERLMMLWWEVNADFFLRRVLTSVQLGMVRKLQAVVPSDGPTPSPLSSMQDTTPGNSASTPTVN